MMLHCDKCDKSLGEYLYGPGGIEERAVILGSVQGHRLPDTVCFDCYFERNPRVLLKRKDILRNDI